MVEEVHDLDPILDHVHVHDLSHRHPRRHIFVFLSFLFSASLISGRAAHAREWDGESGYRLHISPLNPRTSRRDIEKIFGKFGPINEVSRSSEEHGKCMPYGTSFRFGWRRIHLVLLLLISNIELMPKMPCNRSMESRSLISDQIGVHFA